MVWTFGSYTIHLIYGNGTVDLLNKNGVIQRVNMNKIKPLFFSLVVIYLM